MTISVCIDFSKALHTLSYIRLLSKIEKFCFKNSKSTERLWFVFDVVAKYHNLIRNDALLGGLDIVPSFLEQLFLFRQKKVAFIDHICVSPSEDNKRRSRFLGFPMARTKLDVNTMIIITLGSSTQCTIQYVKDYNAQEFADKYTRVVAAIITWSST